MNEITFTGNVSKVHGTRHTQAGDVIFGFDLAVDNGYFDRNRNRWISRTRFQPVVAYRQLAENAAATLTVGSTRFCGSRGLEREPFPLRHRRAPSVVGASRRARV